MKRNERKKTLEAVVEIGGAHAGGKPRKSGRHSGNGTDNGGRPILRSRHPQSQEQQEDG